MKKICACFLALVMVIGMSGCSEQEMSGCSEQEIEIELTPENFEDFFAVEVSVENFKTEKRSFRYDATADVVISCTPKAEFQLINPVVKFEISTPMEDDDAWHEVTRKYATTDGEILAISAHLLPNGEYTKTIAIEGEDFVLLPDAPLYVLHVFSYVSGTLTASKETIESLTEKKTGIPVVPDTESSEES